MREAMTASSPSLLSHNGVESDVSVAGGSPQSAASTPKRPPSATTATTSTPNQNDRSSNKNGDPSTWSKSKKKRMRKKRREAERKAMIQMGGVGGTNGGKKAVSSNKEPASSGEVSDGNSNKRPRKNPAENGTLGNIDRPSGASPEGGTSDISTKMTDDSVAHASSKRSRDGKVEFPQNCGEINGMVADGSSPKEEKKKSEINGMVASGSSSSSPKKKMKKTEINGIVADGSSSNSPKKKKKKKKQPNNSTDQDDALQRQSNERKGKAVARQPQKKSFEKKKGDVAKISSSKEKPNNTKNTGDDKPHTQKVTISLPKRSQMTTLQKAFLERLTSSRFRELNEDLYTHTSQHSFQHFTKNPELFDQYHVGFRKQVKEWPVNPVDVIYKKIVKDWNGRKKDGNADGGGNNNRSNDTVVADFGCGDAKLAERLLALRVGKDGQLTREASGKKKKKGAAEDRAGASRPFKVRSFDLVSGGNRLVTPADMSDVPLADGTVDVGVYSLALMGTNVADFVREAWRVLKFGGTLRVAEVRSRFETASATAEEGRSDVANGGGKLAKSNNRLKHPRRSDHRKDNAKNDADGDGTKPLMLLDEFLSIMERCGFQCTNMDQTNKMFLFMDFVKMDGSKGLSEKERFSAKPCIYKRR